MPDKPYQLAVRAIIRDEQDRCLILRRSKACRSFAGTWEWPGGKADERETPDQALRREVQEETGLSIQLIGAAGAFGIEAPTRHIAVLCLEARLLSGHVQLSEEHDQFAWVPLRDLAQWNLTDGLRQFATQWTRGILPGSTQH